jgi:branched-chain amino acid transport system permease protein
VVYGALIIGFLLIEPMGLGKIYGNVRNYLWSGPSATPASSGS